MIEQKTEMPNTLGELIRSYQTDRVSTYHKLRYHVRKNQESALRRLTASHGRFELAGIKHRNIIEWHMDWTKDGKLSMGHAFIGLIRVLCSYGAAMLEHEQCERIAMVLHRMKFSHAPARTERLTADQADAIRIFAHKLFGWHSIALGQALQFELLLRQRDVIGEWVPEKEPGESDVRDGGEKWLRGLRWEEIDDNLILKHRTSKKQKDLEIDLKLAPMVMDELQFISVDDEGVPLPVLTVDEATKSTTVNRHLLPASGPVMICDTSGLPWTDNEYRRKWRKVAEAAGVPKTVRNMDSRAGGITEATEAGADIEHVKHAATHSDISQTQRYSRGATEKIAEVQKKRNEHRFRRSG